jgi:hypothetical protein
VITGGVCFNGTCTEPELAKKVADHTLCEEKCKEAVSLRVTVAVLVQKVW